VREKIVELANDALSKSTGTPEDQALWEIVGKEALPTSEWLNSIDRGNAKFSNKGRTLVGLASVNRWCVDTDHMFLHAGVWALDPIDGTKGFLRGGQYAVCLALLEDGIPVLGVMGTPNLPLDYNNPSAGTGVLFVTSKGAGAFQVRRLFF
jgi:3'(2'), 5'-bisphosphate nucleotidase